MKTTNKQNKKLKYKQIQKIQNKKLQYKKTQYNLFKYSFKKIIFVLLFALVSITALFNVNADLMALQGTVDNPSAQNIRITIYDSPTGGNLIYDSGTDFNNAISNGRYDILLGSITPLTLEYGKLYYLDISINGENLDFNGSERQVFQSSIGKIIGSYINNSAISSIHILDGSLSGIDIADDSIEKTKIQTTNTWLESEIPSLTGLWTGTINASKIISTNLLNVNSSNTANTAIIANSLQGYSATIFFTNDTTLFVKIENVNTTTNIKKLGFNTTAELDNRYALIGSQSGGGNSTEEIKAVYYPTLSTYANKSLVYDLLSTYANASSVLTLSTLYNTLSSYANQTWVNSNFIAQGTKLGNTTEEIKALYYPTLSSYANQTWVNSNFIAQGTKLGNTTEEIKALYYPTLSTYANTSLVYDLLSTYLNSTDQRFNDTLFISNVNRSENIKSLGFNTTAELDTRYIQQGTKVGNSTQEIQAVYYPTLSTYANQTWVNDNYVQKTNLRTLIYDDFTYWTTTRENGIGVCAALSSGTAAIVTIDDMYGAVRFSDSTTANGGYLCRTDTAMMYFKGNETFTVRFRPNANTANYIFDAGFEDSTTAANPTDGCWFKSTNLVINGNCINNAVQSSTTSSYTLTSGVTYIGKIQVNSDATQVTFTIYDSTGTNVLWTDKVSSNIPITSARAFGVRIGAWQTTTSAAAVIVYWDWVKVEVPMNS